MIFDFEVSDEAEQEIMRIYYWYEDQRAGLGDQFQDRIDQALDLIHEAPYLFAPYNIHFRKMVLPRFPYAVIYEVSEEERVITILRVVHQRRGAKNQE